MDISWRRTGRKTLVNSKHLRVYEDTVELPNGVTLDDYTIVELNTPVLVVAVDNENLLLTREYRYAQNGVLPSLPAGMIDQGETPVDAAKRELLEETGYTAAQFEYVGELLEYPTKISTKTHVVLAKGLTKTTEPKLESTEFFELVDFVSFQELKEKLLHGEIQTAVIIAALYLAIPELRS